MGPRTHRYSAEEASRQEALHDAEAEAQPRTEHGQHRCGPAQGRRGVQVQHLQLQKPIKKKSLKQHRRENEKCLLAQAQDRALDALTRRAPAPLT